MKLRLHGPTGSVGPIMVIRLAMKDVFLEYGQDDDLYYTKLSGHTLVQERVSAPIETLRLID